MAYPTLPTSPAVGDTGTASWANNVAAWTAFLSAPPFFDGYQSAAQSIPTSAWTGLGIDTTVVDTELWHNTTTRYTVQLDGYYRVTTKVRFAGNSTGSRAVGVAVNTGGPVPRSIVTIPAVSAVGVSVHTTWVVACNVGDFIAWVAWQDSGGTLATAASANGETSAAGQVQWISTF